MSHPPDSHVAAAASEPAFTPGPERIALLKKVHAAGMTYGLILWPVVFLLIALWLDSRARLRSVTESGVAEGLGVKGLLMWILFGLIFGVCTQLANQKSISELPA